jgi:hypothetical protein
VKRRLGRAVEESPLLEAIARKKKLVKALDGKDLACSALIFRMRKLTIALLLFVVDL